MTELRVSYAMSYADFLVNVPFACPVRAICVAGDGVLAILQ